MFSRTPVSRALGSCLRTSAPKLPKRSIIVPQARLVHLEDCRYSSRFTRGFCSTPIAHKGLTPDSADPEPNLHDGAKHVAEPADITEGKFHEVADQYIDGLVEKLEKLQEDREDVEVEYSVRSTFGCPLSPLRPTI